MGKAFRILLVGVGSFVLLIAVGSLILFSGLQGDAAGPVLGPGFWRVPGFSAAYVLDGGNGQLALIDTGTDKKGVAVLATLQAHHATADNVAAIFITHSHPDHVGALALFPRATVYAMKREAPLAAGQEPFNGPVFRIFGTRNKLPFTVTHPLNDGEKVTVGNLEVTAFAVPGHTEGSGAYLVNGVLFTGDALQIKTNGQIIGPSPIFSTDKSKGEASLKHLADELQPRANEVKFIASSHTGTIAGLAPLRAFGGS